ncbi:MAG: DUF5071 domain-containing protein [Balneola sp.]|nr:MAG: DUF5071 domain-containing protein [Balneola sp.]
MVGDRKIDLEALLPKDKHDLETAESLKNYSYSEIKNIIPELLEWVQDMNWPVSVPIADYLISIFEHLSSYFIEILKGEDQIWKFYCLHIIKDSRKPLGPVLFSEIERIAKNPTFGEKENDLHHIAMEIVNEGYEEET